LDRRVVGGGWLKRRTDHGDDGVGGIAFSRDDLVAAVLLGLQLVDQVDEIEESHPGR